MSKKYKITAGIVTGLVIIVLVVLWGREDSPAEKTGEASSAVAVEVARPVKQQISEQVPYLGTIVGSKDGNLSFRIQGTLTDMYVKESQKVERGQRLARLSIPELDAQLNRATGEFERATSNRAYWQGELQTDSVLYREGAIAKTALDRTHLNVEQAQGSYRAAEGALQEVQERLQLTTLRAPTPGVIGTIMVRTGSNVSPNQPVFFFHTGTPVIYADVLEQDIQKGIAVGSRVTTKDEQEETIEGRVERIDFQAKPPFRSVRVFVSFPETWITHRPSGAGLSLEFEIGNQDEALMVPVSAIDLRNGSPRILRVNGQNRAEEIAVDLGIQRGELRHIKGAISESDQIIIAGINNVEPGDKVQIMNGSNANQVHNQIN